LTAPDGTQVKLEIPQGEVLPKGGYDAGNDTFIAPPADGSDIQVDVSPTSDRLQLLDPFEKWNGNDFLGMPILMKAKGKCTTDHISAAGKWLTYRGHLQNICGNLFAGVVNAFTDVVGEGIDMIDGQTRTFPEIARHYGDNKVQWTAIGDQNYGEGSSREHAAMEPRYRGAAVIFARSFARIAETNLKKQGIVPLTFADPAMYDMIGELDTITVRDMPPKPDQPVRCYLNQRGGDQIEFQALHTFSKAQVEWFKAGSALNVVRKKVMKAASKTK
jgi:aconitate hydratase